MTTADRVRDECQRLIQEFLTAHPSVAERLRDGDTHQRRIEYLEVLSHVCRKYPHSEINWYDWDQLKREIATHVEEMCKAKVASERSGV